MLDKKINSPKFHLPTPRGVYELELADVFAALAYYHLNRVALQQIWAQDENVVEELRRQIPSKVKRALHE